MKRNRNGREHVRREYSETTKVRFLLSKYQFKKFVAGKHPKSILLTGKVDTDFITKARFSSGPIYLNLDLDTLENYLNQYVVIYVHREYKDPVPR